MQDFDTYLFDWDGTLAKTLHHWVAAFKEVMQERFGVTCSDHEMGRYLFDTGSFVSAELQDIDLASIPKDIVHEIVLPQLQTIELFADTLPTVRTLQQQGKKLGLTTNAVRIEFMHEFERYGLDEVFSVVVTAEDVAHKKPAPDMLLQAMEKLSAGAESTCFVGDSLSDLQAAQAAGITGIAVTGEYREQYHDVELLEGEAEVMVGNLVLLLG